jgi:hypothetical protein
MKYFKVELRDKDLLSIKTDTKTNLGLQEILVLAIQEFKTKMMSF